MMLDHVVIQSSLVSSPESTARASPHRKIRPNQLHSTGGVILDTPFYRNRHRVLIIRSGVILQPIQDNEEGGRFWRGSDCFTIETIVRTAVAELEQPQRLQRYLFASMAGTNSPPHTAPPSDLPAGVPGTLPPLLLSSGSLPETHLKRRLPREQYCSRGGFHCEASTGHSSGPVWTGNNLVLLSLPCSLLWVVGNVEQVSQL